MMDGASGPSILRYIELPLMAPTLAIAFFIRFIDGFRVFDNIYVLVGSGPGGEGAAMKARMALSDTGLDCHYFNHGDQGASDFEKRHGIGRSSAAKW